MRLSGIEKNVFFTGIVSFFMDLSSEMVYPLVPLFLTGVLGVNTSIIGLIEGIAESTASLMKVVSGRLSDRIRDRKYLMIAGYGLAALSRPVLASAGTWHHVLAARFIDRFGKGVRTAPRDALIAASTNSAYFGRAFGFHRALDTAGALCGPAAAFLLLAAFSQNVRAVFWISLLPAAIAVLTLAGCITETKAQHTPNSHCIRHPARARLAKNVKYFIVIAGLFALGNSSDVFLILKANHAGIATSFIPVVYLVFNGCYALTAIPFGMAADRFGPERIIGAGFCLFAVVYYGFGVTTSFAGIWLLFAVYGVFMGLTEGVYKAYIARLTSDAVSATAFGIYGTVVGCTMLPANLIAGWLWEHVSPAAPFYFGAFTAGTAALLFFLLCMGKNHE